MGNITDLIKDVANKNQIIETFAAKVIEINNETESAHNTKDAYTVNIMRADGAILKNVRLKASILDVEQGIITIPKKDSWVLATIIDGVETRAFVSQFSEIERSFIRFKNDENQYLEINTEVGKLQMLFKQSSESASSTAKPTYKNIAQIEFSSKKDSNITTSFYDENGKEISKNIFNGNQQQTILSTVNGEDIKERLKFTLTSGENSNAAMQFFDKEGTEKQKITFDELHTEINLNKGNTIFNLKDKEAKVTIKDGFEATISDTKTSFTKGDLTLEMDGQFKIDVGGKSLKSKLEELIDEIGKITVPTPMGPSGPPINLPQLTILKGKLTELLK
ncbi:hypothetical protein [Flavobacterium aquidurense]|jgi:hypothetical protein|uniref:hypothetical protein n=1 Tax=Flavobacterium aquidurense TaxID=362413 RepID=UPI000911EB37|nr:hypothetical protein [Flavobacterium aquidurense]SHH20626.1 hypothetical protein SAMN05444481_11348 [Flavobacterium frigidimaris]